MPKDLQHFPVQFDRRNLECVCACIWLILIAIFPKLILQFGRKIPCDRDLFMSCGPSEGKVRVQRLIESKSGSLLWKIQGQVAIDLQHSQVQYYQNTQSPWRLPWKDWKKCCFVQCGVCDWGVRSFEHTPVLNNPIMFYDTHTYSEMKKTPHTFKLGHLT